MSLHGIIQLSVFRYAVFFYCIVCIHFDLILKFFISNIMPSQFTITHFQLIHTEQFSIFLTKRGQSIFLYLVSVSPPCFLEMHISLFDIREEKKKYIKNIENKKEYKKSTSWHLLPFYQRRHSEFAFTINIRRHLHYSFLQEAATSSFIVYIEIRTFQLIF